MCFENFEIDRSKKFGVYHFSEVFKNLDNCKILWKFFGSREKFVKAIKKQNVRISRKKWIFWINDKKNEITIYKNYLEKCPEKILYLDCIHELVHVKQLKEGKNLWDERFGYVDRPTEIEAYIIAAKEAKRIGMSKKEIAEYLCVSWASDEENQRLVKIVLSKI